MTTDLTKERIAGFLLGISVGTAVGFFLRPESLPQQDDRTTRRVRAGDEVDDVRHGTRADRSPFSSIANR